MPIGEGERPPLSLDGRHLSFESAIHGSGVIPVWDDKMQKPALVRSRFVLHGDSLIEIYEILGADGTWYREKPEEARQYFEMLKDRPSNDRDEAARILAQELEKLHTEFSG